MIKTLTKVQLQQEIRRLRRELAAARESAARERAKAFVSGQNSGKESLASDLRTLLACAKEPEFKDVVYE